MSFLVGRTRFSDPNISRFHFLSIFRCSCHRLQDAFFCVRVDGALVAENLRLVWENPESHFLSCFLEFTHHFPYLFFGSCEQHHVVGKSQVREAVMIIVAQVYTHAIVEFRPSESIIFRTELSRTVCTTRAMSKSGGSYSHFPRLLSCVSLLSSLSSSLQA